MPSPVNNAGPNTCQQGSLSKEGEKRVNGATQLTPWRKGNWPLWNRLLKCGGHHSGGPVQHMTVRETQNRCTQIEHGVGHKPQTGSPDSGDISIGCITDTDPSTCMKYRWQMPLFFLSYPKLPSGSSFISILAPQLSYCGKILYSNSETLYLGLFSF